MIARPAIAASDDTLPRRRGRVTYVMRRRAATAALRGGDCSLLEHVDDLLRDGVRRLVDAAGTVALAPQVGVGLAVLVVRGGAVRVGEAEADVAHAVVEIVVVAGGVSAYRQMQRDDG